MAETEEQTHKQNGGQARLKFASSALSTISLKGMKADSLRAIPLTLSYFKNKEFEAVHVLIISAASLLARMT